MRSACRPSSRRALLQSIYRFTRILETLSNFRHACCGPAMKINRVSPHFQMFSHCSPHPFSLLPRFWGAPAACALLVYSDRQFVYSRYERSILCTMCGALAVSCFGESKMTKRFYLTNGEKVSRSLSIDRSRTLRRCRSHPHCGISTFFTFMLRARYTFD